MQARMRKHLHKEETNWFELAGPRWYGTLAERETTAALRFSKRVELVS